MKTRSWIFTGLASAIGLPFASAPLSGQVLHVNDQWKNCAIVIDPALTQASWHRFVREAGLVTYFRPLASARPLGAKSFEVALLDWGTRIDPASDAWNDTFSHPHPTHSLTDGNALLIPGLMLRVGVTDRIDVGGYVTKSPQANYGFFGGQAQYGFLNDPVRNLAAAARVSFVKLYGPEDMDLSVYGVELVASKDFSRLSPYVGVSGYWSRGKETTSKVDLADESIVGLQGMVGVEARVSVVRLGAEFNAARVSGYSFKVAFGS